MTHWPLLLHSFFNKSFTKVWVLLELLWLRWSSSHSSDHKVGGLIPSCLQPTWQSIFEQDTEPNSAPRALHTGWPLLTRNGLNAEVQLHYTLYLLLILFLDSAFTCTMCTKLVTTHYWFLQAAAASAVSPVSQMQSVYLHFMILSGDFVNRDLDLSSKSLTNQLQLFSEV